MAAKNSGSGIDWSRIEWTNFLFLSSLPIVTFSLMAVEVSTHGWNLGILIFTALYAMASSLSITGGYHRLFAHRAYQASKPVQFLYLLFGAAAIQNSALRWCWDHRYHHRFVDTDKDPYNIKRGFFYAHMGWIFYKGTPTTGVPAPADLSKDPFILWQHQNYLPLALFMGFGVPTLVGAAFGSALGGFVFAGLFRVFFTHHCTFLINSGCHYFGNQPYSERTTARDSAFMAVFSYGEGYHNFHHTFECDYRNGVRWYQWDPTKWLVSLLSFLGQTSDLRTVSQKEILSARLRMAEIRLQRNGVATENLSALKNQVEQALDKMRTMREEYQRLKREGQARSEEMVRKIKSEIRQAKSDFKRAYADWKQAYREISINSATA